VSLPGYARNYLWPFQQRTQTVKALASIWVEHVFSSGCPCSIIMSHTWSFWDINEAAFESLQHFRLSNPRQLRPSDERDLTKKGDMSSRYEHTKKLVQGGVWPTAREEEVVPCRQRLIISTVDACSDFLWERHVTFLLRSFNFTLPVL
jgi:hypothetical protein